MQTKNERTLILPHPMFRILALSGKYACVVESLFKNSTAIDVFFEEFSPTALNPETEMERQMKTFTLIAAVLSLTAVTAASSFAQDSKPMTTKDSSGKTMLI